jgi:hypothetical protein
MSVPHLFFFHRIMMSDAKRLQITHLNLKVGSDIAWANMMHMFSEYGLALKLAKHTQSIVDVKPLGSRSLPQC